MQFFNINFSLIKNKIALNVISVMFLLVYFHYIFNQSFSHRNISILILVMFCGYAYAYKVIKPTRAMLLFCLASFVTVTLSYHMFSRMELIPSNLYRTYSKLIHQYLWFVAFLCLPTVYYYSDFKLNDFYKPIWIALAFLLVYLSYWGIQLQFDRGAFSSFFNPVISYDIGFISLCILALCYAFYIKGKVAYVTLILSILTLFMLILHGSRGTWLGIPLVLAVLSLFYFKTQPKKLMLTIGMFILFIFINMVIPHSPLKSRIEHLQADTHSIENNNYQNSAGTRIYLWKHSVELFKQSTLIGVGMHEIELENCRLFQQGKLPMCFQHMHSIYFHELAANGILGLIGLLVTFASALIFFIKNLFSSNTKIKQIALTGLVFVLYYMVCGVTEYYLFFKNTTYLFYWVVASLMSFICIESFKKRSVTL